MNLFKMFINDLKINRYKRLIKKSDLKINKLERKLEYEKGNNFGLTTEAYEFCTKALKELQKG